MSKRTTGTILLFIAALLYATRYIAAAIFGSGMLGWSAENFQALLQYVGSDLTTWSIVALVLGVVYVLWAEVEVIWISRKGSHFQQPSKE
jgi:hypothetical protein